MQNMKSCYELIPERRYIIQRIKNNKIELLEGVFVSLVAYSPTTALMRCMKRKSLPNVAHFGFSYDYDLYYDIQEIRDNAKRARQNMEHRAVNKILRRLINEEFEW
jgi:hypothetical protein